MLTTIDHPTQPATGKCQICEREFATRSHGYRTPNGITWLTAGVCDPCYDQKQSVAEKAARQLFELKENWERRCPKGYADTKTEQIPQWPRCLEWLRGMPVSGRGLYLYGAPRQRKTRAGWMLVKEIAFKLKFRWDAHLWSRFMQDLAGAYGASAEVAADILERASRVHVLFLDDVGQDVATPRAGDTLKKILEERCSHHRPTIITSNLGGEALAQHYGEFGEQIRGRIRDHFEQVKF
jgi:DNA replication protein DnaC